MAEHKSCRFDGSRFAVSKLTGRGSEAQQGNRPDLCKNFDEQIQGQAKECAHVLSTVPRDGRMAPLFQGRDGRNGRGVRGWGVPRLRLTLFFTIYLLSCQQLLYSSPPTNPILPTSSAVLCLSEFRNSQKTRPPSPGARLSSNQMSSNFRAHSIR